MKRKRKIPLSSSQKKRLIRISLILVLTAFLWLIFAPKMGMMALYKEKSHLAELEEKKVQLENENAALRQEIERIENDVDYFEQLAREKHGLLKKNEVIFDFSREDKQGSEK